MTHWRDTCRIKSFVIPYDDKSFHNTISKPFMRGSRVISDVYDCVGIQYLDFMPIKVKYERRA